MPHGGSYCKGGPKGVPWDAKKWCRVCWLKNNPKAVSSPSIPVTVQSQLPATANQAVRPPCIHLGQVREWASPGCNKHVYDCAIHDRCKTFEWDSKPLACCVGCKADPRNAAIPDCTIAITYWQRPAALKRLLESIRVYLPNTPHLVEDTGGNLSAGRNRLYAKIQTPFLIMFEEDFVVLPETAAGLRAAVEILRHDPAIAGVGGIANEPHPGQPPPGQQAVRSRGAVRWGHNFIRKGDRVGITASARLLRSTPTGTSYRPCDIVLHFGVFRTSLYKDVPYDEGFPIHEHKEYFWRASQAGKEFAFLGSLRIDHIRDHPTADWLKFRRRSFSHRVKAKHGFTFDLEV